MARRDRLEMPDAGPPVSAAVGAVRAGGVAPPLLQPGTMAIRREDAMQPLSELGLIEERLDRLRNGLRALVDEEG